MAASSSIPPTGAPSWCRWQCRAMMCGPRISSASGAMAAAGSTSTPTSGTARWCRWPMRRSSSTGRGAYTRACRSTSSGSSAATWAYRCTRPESGPGARLLEADHELRGMRAPVDRDHVQARMRHGDLVRLVGDHGRHRDDEVLAEVAPRIAGDRVRDLPDHIAQDLLARVRLLDAHQHHGEHRAPRGEVHHALARAGDADDAGVVVGLGLAVGHQVGRADRGRLLHHGFEEVRGAVDEGTDFGFAEHVTAPMPAALPGPR